MGFSNLFGIGRLTTCFLSVSLRCLPCSRVHFLKLSGLHWVLMLMLYSILDQIVVLCAYTHTERHIIILSLLKPVLAGKCSRSLKLYMGHEVCVLSHCLSPSRESPSMEENGKRVLFSVCSFASCHCAFSPLLQEKNRGFISIILSGNAEPELSRLNTFVDRRSSNAKSAVGFTA